MGRGKRHTVDEGLALIRRHVRALESEIVSAADAVGRVSAAPLISKRTVPSFRAAAMDGYAVHSDETAAASPTTPACLPVTGSVPAGAQAHPLPSREAYSIGTGAPVPAGADAVIMYESVLAADDEIILTSPAKPGLNIREIGEDTVRESVVAPAGLLITPDVVAAMAAYAVPQISVVRQPVLALIVTGSELRQTAPSQQDATILDSNGPMVRAQCAELGLPVLDIGTVPDERSALDEALDAALSADTDIILSTGGASDGERDLVRDAVADRGAQIIFHGLSMRPGKPLLFAILPDGRPFFGLPGNPVSACIAMRFFVSQALRCMLGLPPEQGAQIECASPGRSGTTLFLRGRRSRDPSGAPCVDMDLDQRSHILSSVVIADCWIRVDQSGDQTRHQVFPKRLTFEAL